MAGRGGIKTKKKEAKQEGEDIGENKRDLKWEMRDQMTWASTPDLWFAPWQL